MKKVLSVLCMALLAGGMIFTSCTKHFTITVKSNNDAWGTVTGGGTFNDQVTTTLKATPNAGYQFVQWQDGTKENPRTITVTADETWTAYFEPVTPGVKVTFGNEAYDAGDYAGVYSSQYEAWQVTAAKTNGDYPYADVAMYTGTSTGTSTAQAAEDGKVSTSNSDFGWVEYYLEGYVYYESNPNVHFGDWWAKSATVNVSDFDATALKMTANVNATMFDVMEAFADGEGIDGATSAPMAVKMTSVSLNSSKGFTPKKNNGGRIVAAR